MLKLYIFDMGGVVSLNTDVSEQISARLGLDTGNLWELMREEIVSLMAGSITAAEFWRQFSSKRDLQVDEDLWALTFQPRPNREVIETIRALKTEARVVVGTNTIEPHYQVHSKNGDYDIFNRVYASHQIGLVKPDPAFYTYILNSENCSPAETVFVDDAEINVEAARKLGIHGLRFEGAAKLRRDLAALKRDERDGLF
jgi:HAD superfamily hydrolase (TIGR01509 family)